jgi:hypothetical protein
MKPDRGKVALMPPTSPKPEENPEEDQENPIAYQKMPENSRHAAQPSGPKGDIPATAGLGPTEVKSNTPENRLGHINPSAPEDANTTPGTSREK